MTPIQTAAEWLESLERKIGRPIGPAAPPASESLSEFRQRHGVPELSACFAGHRPLQEGDSGKLTAFRKRHVVTPDMPTSRGLGVLQESIVERATSPTLSNVLVNYRRRLLVNG